MPHDEYIRDCESPSIEKGEGKISEKIGNIYITHETDKYDRNIIRYIDLLNPEKFFAIFREKDGSIEACKFSNVEYYGTQIGSYYNAICNKIINIDFNSMDKLIRDHFREKEERKKDKKKILSNLEEINAKLDNEENLKKIKKDTALLSLLSILRP